jgi:hypothetical protein
MRNGKPAMSKGERDDLIRLIRQRERAQETAATERSKELLADFERHLGTIFRYDRNEVWKAGKPPTKNPPAHDKPNHPAFGETQRVLDLRTTNRHQNRLSPRQGTRHMTTQVRFNGVAVC